MACRSDKGGISANTCNRDLATLKSALGRARVWKIISIDPLVGVKQSKVDSTRVRYLAHAEEKRLRAALVERVRRSGQPVCEATSGAQSAG